MRERTIFPNAPIKEAILDIRVTLPKETTLDKLETFHVEIKNNYPKKVARIKIEFRGEKNSDSKAPPKTSASEEQIGFLFRSSDGRDIAQARLDGFSLSRLKPYKRWETFRDQAKPLWEHYKQIASPEVITRIALRYINRIEIPLPLRDFKDYILTAPEIAPGLPQTLKNFFFRVEIPFPIQDSIALITETIDADTNPKVLPLIFDIDVIQKCALDAKSNEVWEVLEELHKFKNDLFFKSITSKTRELFS